MTMQSFPNTTHGRRQATTAIRVALKEATWADLERYADKSGISAQTLYQVQQGSTRVMFNGSLEKAGQSFDIELREPLKRGRPKKEPFVLALAFPDSETMEAFRKVAEAVGAKIQEKQQ